MRDVASEAETRMPHFPNRVMVRFKSRRIMRGYGLLSRRLGDIPMLGAGRGLRDVPTEDLRRLLRNIHRDQISCPLTADGLACLGLQDRSESLLGMLRGLETKAVRSVLIAVLAERSR